MLTITADIKNSISRIEELKEYEKIVKEIREMYRDAADKCTAALNAGQYEAAIAWFGFMGDCEDQLSSITNYVKAAY